MNRIKTLLRVFILILVLHSCSKRIHPAATVGVTPISGVTSDEVKKSDTTLAVVKKAVVKQKPKADFPKIITVNDSAAQKSVDGRLYYDVLGHRYWKNYQNGKYYLFNKSMYSNPAFRARE